MKPLSDSVRTHLESMTATFQAPQDAVADYLASRGLSAETAQDFRLGYVPAGVAGYERYAGMLAIPYLSAGGVIALRFRRLDDGKPKYLSLQNAQNVLFNTRVLGDNALTQVAVTEGEIDAITLCQAGYEAVAAPGARTWKPYHRRMFDGYDTVWVVTDGDDDGRDLAALVARDVDSARVVELPEGLDVNSLYLKEGNDGLARLFK